MRWQATVQARSSPPHTAASARNACDRPGDHPAAVRLALYRAVDDGRRGLRQTAFEILVAYGQAELDRDVGDLWASGKVVPDQSVHVAYTGRPLKPRGRRCFWKVRLWDQDGRPSP